MDPKTFSPNAPGSLQYAPEGYWTYHPYALPPLFRWTDRLVTALSAADRAAARLGMRAGAVPPAALIRIEAAASSRLAGLEISAAELALAEAAGAHAPHLLPPAEQAAIALVQSLAQPALQPDFTAILRAHARLLPGETDPRWPPGEFRRGQTWIGPDEDGPAAAAFVPPPPEEMLPALDSLIGFIHAPPKLPNLVRLALVHYQFGVIHPFYDANGRMGRLLVSWLFVDWGLLPAACLPLSRRFEAHAGVMDALLSAVSRENAWENWLVFFLNGVTAEAEAAISLLDRLEALQAHFMAVLESERNAPRLQQVAAKLPAFPCVTVNQVAGWLDGGNFKSASRVVERLVEKELLEEMTGQHRHRVFAAPAVLEAFREV